MARCAELAKLAQVAVVHPRERALAVHLARFPEALAIAIDELAPNRITEFLYDLTDIFNSFYTDCKARL